MLYVTCVCDEIYNKHVFNDISVCFSNILNGNICYEGARGDG